MVRGSIGVAVLLVALAFGLARPETGLATAQGHPWPVKP
jgi:hypothetical protein